MKACLSRKPRDEGELFLPLLQSLEAALRETGRDKAWHKERLALIVRQNISCLFWCVRVFFRGLNVLQRPRLFCDVGGPNIGYHGFFLVELLLDNFWNYKTFLKQ
ncbi:hypothetical protein AVEN_125919-1 [Araneus ventricosus]|uniref:Uncharacterized protein n=1 Tax=Araneus ventricosus TaxID=182803 RepID=A0A4Y2U3C4_ARAVE|nr:hypothetical protein AVEN_125919-1 [Araneus ventricosus]